MSIKKRRANLGTVEHRGRHKLLKLGSPHLLIYNFIKDHPNCTRYEIAKGTSLEKDQVTKRAAELISEGLVVAVGTKKCDYTGRRVSILHISGSNETGFERDKLVINLKIYRGLHGSYGVKAHIVNFKADEFDIQSLVLEKDISVYVPKPNEPIALQTFANKQGLTIDADFEIIEPDS